MFCVPFCVSLIWLYMFMLSFFKQINTRTHAHTQKHKKTHKNTLIIKWCVETQDNKTKHYTPFTPDWIRTAKFFVYMTRRRLSLALSWSAALESFWLTLHPSFINYAQLLLIAPLPPPPSFSPSPPSTPSSTYVDAYNNIHNLIGAKYTDKNLNLIYQR